MKMPLPRDDATGLTIHAPLMRWCVAANSLYSTGIMKVFGTKLKFLAPLKIAGVYCVRLAGKVARTLFLVLRGAAHIAIQEKCVLVTFPMSKDKDKRVKEKLLLSCNFCNIF